MAIVVLHQDFPIHCPCITDQSWLFVGACLARQGGPELSQILIDIDYFVRVFVFIDILQARPSAEDTLPDITCRKFYYYLAVLACSLAAHTMRDCDVPGLQWWVDLDWFTHTQDCIIGVIMLGRFGDATDSEAVSTTMLFKVVEFKSWILYCLLLTHHKRLICPVSCFLQTQHFFSAFCGTASFHSWRLGNVLRPTWPAWRNMPTTWWILTSHRRIYWTSWKMGKYRKVRVSVIDCICPRGFVLWVMVVNRQL